MNSALVTGGAGYIGRHGALQRSARDECSGAIDILVHAFRNSESAEK
ncbi:MAG: hypothetical protein ACREPQ_02420 [Rhodanobacter sp.]